MPGTAATQNQSRTHAKARPSANARPASLLESTPVLFRLPTIETAATKNLAATFSEAAVSLPTAALSAVASTANATPEPAETPAQATPHLTKDRTWWEHWSSGIVLIVLLIALATASVLAWQGNSNDKSKLLADTKEKEDTNSSLASIEIPKIDQPRIEPSAAVSAMKANADAIANKSAHPESDASEELSLIPDAKSLSFDPPKSSGADPTAASSKVTLSKPEPAATASLQKPLAKSQEPLFKDAPLSAAVPFLHSLRHPPSQRCGTSLVQPRRQPTNPQRTTPA